MNHRAGGFSLMEALITLLLVLLGLTGAARLQASLMAVSAEAKARDEAAAFAEDMLAELAAVASYTDYRERVIPGSLRRQGLLHDYRIEWQVAHSADPDYKRVDIQLRWPAADPIHSLQLQTVVPGLEPARFAAQQLPPAGHR